MIPMQSLYDQKKLLEDDEISYCSDEVRTIDLDEAQTNAKMTKKLPHPELNKGCHLISKSMAMPMPMLAFDHKKNMTNSQHVNFVPSDHNSVNSDGSREGRASLANVPMTSSGKHQTLIEKSRFFGFKNSETSKKSDNPPQNQASTNSDKKNNSSDKSSQQHLSHILYRTSWLS